MFFNLFIIFYFNFLNLILFVSVIVMDSQMVTRLKIYSQIMFVVITYLMTCRCNIEQLKSSIFNKSYLIIRVQIESIDSYSRINRNPKHAFFLNNVR